MTNAPMKATNATALRNRFASHAPTVRRVVSMLSDAQLLARFVEHEQLRKKWRKETAKTEHTTRYSRIAFLVPDFTGTDGVRYSDISVEVLSEGSTQGAAKLARSLERCINIHHEKTK